jgi:phosphoserine phosphatase
VRRREIPAPLGPIRRIPATGTTSAVSEGLLSARTSNAIPNGKDFPAGAPVTEAVEELEHRRAESNQRADDARARRDRLNAEARVLADERGAILDDLHDKSAEAQEHRRARDELNERVRDEKRLREEWNRKLLELSDKVQQVKQSRTPRPGAIPVWRLRKELKELEFRHMTTALTPDAEKRLIADMQRLEQAIREQDEQMRQDPEIEKALAETNAARAEAEKHHAAVGEFAEQAQRAHEAMVGLYESVDDLRRRADEVQAKLIEVKSTADEAHRAHIAAIEEVRDIEKLLYATRGGRAPSSYATAEPPREEDFLARLKKGEKVSTEDLLELQKTGRG